MFGQGFERLLAAARRGDEQAWAALYLDIAPALRGYLAGRGCPTPDDTTSETVLQVVRDLHRFDGDERAFRSWVFTIAHHRLIDGTRYEAARPSEPVDDEFLDRNARSVSFEEHAIAHLGPPELEHLLVATTPEQRDVVLLRYVADLTLHEVAEVLEKEYNAVKALHRRAMDALRAHVRSDAYPNEGGRTLTSSG